MGHKPTDNRIFEKLDFCHKVKRRQLLGASRKNRVKRTCMIDGNYVSCAFGRNIFKPLKLHFKHKLYKRSENRLDEIIQFIVLYLRVIKFFH